MEASTSEQCAEHAKLPSELAVEEDFRAHAIDLARGPEVFWPWGQALIGATRVLILAPLIGATRVQIFTPPYRGHRGGKRRFFAEY